MDNRKLTEKQKRFVDYYMMTSSVKAAARLAGYSESNYTSAAWKNMKLPAVQAAIQERRKILDDQGIADVAEIQEYWTSVMRGREIEKHLSNSGKEYLRITPVSSRLRASENLAKAHGIFLKSNIEKKKEDVNIIWIDDYGEEDYPEED